MVGAGAVSRPKVAHYIRSRIASCQPNPHARHGGEVRALPRTHRDTPVNPDDLRSACVVARVLAAILRPSDLYPVKAHFWRICAN